MRTKNGASCERLLSRSFCTVLWVNWTICYWVVSAIVFAERTFLSSVLERNVALHLRMELLVFVSVLLCGFEFSLVWLMYSDVSSFARIAREAHTFHVEQICKVLAAKRKTRWPAALQLQGQGQGQGQLLCCSQPQTTTTTCPSNAQPTR